MTFIEKNVLDHAMSYAVYVEKIKILLAEGRTATTDEMNRADLIHYTQLNVQRMHRLDKTTHLTEGVLEQIKNIQSPLILLDITEGWCGDAAQIVPVIEKIAAAHPSLQHKIIFRDEHPDIMDAFLTEGSRSIPKILILNEEGQVLASWGPRPQALQERVLQKKIEIAQLPKEARKEAFENAKADVQKWYNADKTQHIQKEFEAILAVAIQKNRSLATLK